VVKQDAENEALRVWTEQEARPTMAGMRIAVVALALAAASACHTVENAAARDPMRCERDPGCSKGRASYQDCTRQCNDDPECVGRCREIQMDRMGHP